MFFNIWAQQAMVEDHPTMRGRPDQSSGIAESPICPHPAWIKCACGKAVKDPNLGDWSVLQTMQRLNECPDAQTEFCVWAPQ
jgi:hypothetical protein